MPQPDRAPVGERRVADGVDQVRFNQALRVANASSRLKAAGHGCLREGSVSDCSGRERGYTELPGADHKGAWEFAYADEAIAKWLLAQHRQ